jgi:hypothetical protein
MDGYKQVLGKIYAGYHVAGQYGDDNESDVTTISDGGMSSYIRNYWNFQELPTGEVKNAWNDGGLVAIQNGNWSADNQYVAGMYYRLYYMISLSNEFLRQSSDAMLDERGQSDLKEEMEQLRGEARLVRAIAYYHGIYLFGQMSIIDENFTNKYPVATSGAELFSWIVSELQTIETLLPDANTAEYGRMDKGVVWMVLAKMYLNAEAFSGTQNPVEGVNSMDEVVKYTELVNGSYSLEPNYLKLFSTDNDEAEGIIFGIPIDPDKTQGFSATQYVISSSTNGAFGTFVNTTGTWGGNHATRSVYDQFTIGDNRGKTESATAGDNLDFNTMLVINAGLDMDNPLDYTQGLNVFKFRNRKSDGSYPDVTEAYFVDTDWPMFRLADAYLMYAEAVVRGGNGTSQKALDYVNAIRQRAFGDDSGQIFSTQLTLDFLLQERGREFYYEGYRRQDLIRFGKFIGSDYLWPWKGGVADGRALDSFRKVYPFPSCELRANPNAVQNDNY